jgi:uncharacterized protein involved in type VI secretion and phage assembly
MTLDILKVIVQVGLIPDLSVFSDVLEVVVDTSVYLPGMCTISFEERLPEGGVIFEHIDNMLKYKIGEKVIVSVFTDSLRNKGIPDANIIFNGEVTSIEPVFEKSGRAVLRIRAFDKGHRLTKGKKFRTFQMMNDMLIIQKIAAEAGLPATVVSPRLTTMYTHVIQYDQSDWDFLWDRAQLFGCQMFVDNFGVLHFESAGMMHGPTTELSWGKALVQFEPRLVSMGQVTEAAVGGWDSNLKMKISAKMPGAASVPMNIIGNALTGPMTEAMAFSSSTDYSVDTPMHNIGQALQVAGALVDEHANQFIRASGEVNTCIPGLVAGSRVLVTNVGIRFTGTYYVSEAKHIFRNGDYRILFQVSGQNPYTIRHLINGNDLDRNKINGVVIGIVTNNQDPLMAGRVKVKYPWIPSTMEIEGDWARVASIGGGTGGGLMFLPEVNDEVLVTFEHGDINFPYIVGVLWNGKDRPPQGKGAIVAGGKVNQRVIRSRSGHTVIFDDTMGKEQIIIQDKTGNNSITIDSTMNAMTIKAQGDLKIEAGGKLTLTSNADFSVDTKTKGTISAATSVEVKGNTGAKMTAGASSLDLQAATAALKSPKVDVTADTMASLKGNAMVEIQGGLVKIN